MSCTNTFEQILDKTIEDSNRKNPDWLHQEIDWESFTIKACASVIDNIEYNWFDTTTVNEDEAREDFMFIIIMLLLKCYQDEFIESRKEDISLVSARFSQKFLLGFFHQKTKSELPHSHWVKQLGLGSLSKNTALLISSIGSLSSSLNLSLCEIKKMFFTAIYFAEYIDCPFSACHEHNLSEIEGKNEFEWFQEIIEKILIDEPELDHHQLEVTSRIIMNKVYDKLNKKV
ncbi:hypothetical protein JCM30760_26670 [Thiomicrorhabdus hydrogeniphila]